MEDDRWGGYIPWFLRNQDIPIVGDYLIFFQRIAQRLNRFFSYNETAIPNLGHFGALLETESFQRFHHSPDQGLSIQVSNFFDPTVVRVAARELLSHDAESRKVAELQNKVIEFRRGRLSNKSDCARIQEELAVAEKNRDLTAHDRFRRNLHHISIERIGVLEILLRAALRHGSQHAGYDLLITDIRKFLAEAKLMLDIRDGLFIPLDEPLLQKEVIDQVLRRLSARFPDRARELMSAYHAVIEGRSSDTVFSEAFKTLEEIARSLTGDKSFVFSQKFLSRHFPDLHPTIHETMIRLAGHRGDEAGHGKSGPDSHEIRYLLFSICNIALLLLDYPEK